MKTKITFTKEEFITNKALLTKYSERQLIAMHEMLLSGMFADSVIYLLKKDNLVNFALGSLMLK